MKQLSIERGATLLCQNSREALQDLGAFDCIVTDPPYSMGQRERSEWAVSSHVPIILGMLPRHLRKGGTMAVFSASSGRSVDMICSAVNLPLLRVLTWVRTGARSLAGKGWRYDSVLVLIFGSTASCAGAGSSVIITDRSDEETADHPSRIPPEVCDWLVRPMRPKHILDPFCGSGELLAAGMRASAEWCLGIDRDPGHIGLAKSTLARWL